MRIEVIYHEKLIPLHGMRMDYEFEDYATNLYSKGKVLCGSFFEHINVSIYRMDH